METKAKNRAYTGYDDDEFVEGRAGMKKAVLAKYDEDINGPQEMVCAVNSFRRLSIDDMLTGLSPRHGDKKPQNWSSRSRDRRSCG